MKRSTFFNGATAPATRTPKRAPIVVDDRTRARRRSELQAQFVNAESAIGSQLIGLFPVPLRDALGLTSSSSDSEVQNQILNRADALTSEQTISLFDVLISAIKRGEGNATAALAKAQKLLPQLASLAAPAQ
jgi:hypothetical protein